MFLESKVISAQLLQSKMGQIIGGVIYDSMLGNNGLDGLSGKHNTGKRRWARARR